MQPVQHISPQEYAAARVTQTSSPPAHTPMATLIDVREPWEYEIAHIEGAQLLPLDRIHEWAQTLDKGGAYVVVCHHGSRSTMACQVLQGLGFRNVKNLDGGIESWSYAVDPRVARY